MKMLTCLVMLVAVSMAKAEAISAAKTYLCEARVPAGIVRIVAHQGFGIGNEISVSFDHKRSNQNYSGTLVMTDRSIRGDRRLHNGFGNPLDCKKL